jgi:dihydroorotate dehydrogenase (fumarate)
MCGASAVQLVSAIYAEGPKHIGRLRNEMSAWMEEKEYESLAQMRGSMDIHSCPNPRALSRANYMHQLRTFDQMRL